MIIIIIIIIFIEYQLLRAMKNALASLHIECGGIFMDISGVALFVLYLHANLKTNNIPFEHISIDDSNKASEA